MGSDDLLVMAMALPPVWLSAKLWWSTRHAVDQLRESCSSQSGSGRDVAGSRRGAPGVLEGEPPVQPPAAECW